MKTLKKHIVILGFLFAALALTAKDPANISPLDDGYRKSVRIVSVKVQPAEVPLDKHKMHVQIVISQGLGRKSFISIKQTDLNHAAQIAFTQLKFDAEQTIVEGDVNITCYKVGSATLQAKIENLYDKDSVREKTINIVDKK